MNYDKATSVKPWTRGRKACEFCDRQNFSRGMCKVHYQRWWKDKPLTEEPERKPVPVDRADEVRKAREAYALASSLASRMFWRAEIQKLEAVKI